MSEIARDSHDVEIDGKNFHITALGTSAGFETMAKMAELEDGSIPDPLFMRKLIMSSVSVNNVALTEKSYELMFSRKHKYAMELFHEILKFNFPQMYDPNAEGDTPEA